ncbi:hypothetical protein FA13DRAFT_1788813 [Coprinellus micaceus]|uniref:Mucoidy inhibitor A n=1 Tax=Coprinellus micaceus TaxID=71717 RepID=A0A4Y7TM29_COPMI|nr:hypothetical protein FA13DRAFT_1788813 [Coprinellus micaceus]
MTLTLVDGQTQLPDYPVNSVKLSVANDSKITSVNLYSQHAEVSRSFQLKLASGQNNVAISDFSDCVDEESIRVGGQGDATIHDVTTSWNNAVQPLGFAQVQNSFEWQDLQRKRQAVDTRLNRYRATLASLETCYLKSVTADKVHGAELIATMDSYNEAAEKYENMVEGAVAEQAAINAEITKMRAEANAGAGQTGTVRRRGNLDFNATLSIFAPAKGEIELNLTYAVSSASWTPLYDVRVKTETKEAPVEIVYKAAIQQNTGEAWDNVPIALQTAKPTFGIALPKLQPWNISILPPVVVGVVHRGAEVSPSYARRSPSYSPGRRRERRSRSKSPRYQAYYPTSPRYSPTSPPPLRVQETEASQNGVHASFKVPGLVTVPSDAAQHNVTIANLTPEAKLAWLVVPSVDTKVHLTTSVKNTSEYTLLAGTTKVYVDGSFIAKTTIPLVSPQETFVCPLGLDPSIRVTYHPRIKKGTQSGLITKTTSTTFSQRITVHNTKPVSIEGLQVIDRIPISQDSQIKVNLTSPPLRPDTLVPLKVMEGVVALWHAENEVEGLGLDVNGNAGNDGHLAWTCKVASLKKVELSLAWEVSAPSQVALVGL